MTVLAVTRTKHVHAFPNAIHANDEARSAWSWFRNIG